MTQHRNVIIVGSGPAGYTAALYTARVPSDPARRESFVKNLLAAAVLPGATGRPSSRRTGR